VKRNVFLVVFLKEAREVAVVLCVPDIHSNPLFFTESLL